MLPMLFVIAANWAVASDIPATNYTSDPTITSDMATQLEHMRQEIARIGDPTIRLQLLAKVDAMHATMDTSRVRPQQLQAYYRQLDERRTDDERLALLSRFADTQSFATNEIRVLLQTFEFDAARAEALIRLYPSCTDPQAYPDALADLRFRPYRQRVADTLFLATGAPEAP